MSSTDKNEPRLLKDRLGSAIQALAPLHADTVSVSIVDANAITLTIPTGTKYYELASIIPLYIDADGTASVTSALFPAGVATYKVGTDQTAVSAKRVDSADTGPVTLTPLG